MLVIFDLNIDTLNKKKDNRNYFSDLYDSFSLKNLMTNITCVKSINGSSTDVFLTYRIRSFHQTAAFESGLSDSHKIILTFSRAHKKKLPHKNIEHQNFKNFYKYDFLHELAFKLSKGTIYKFKDNQYDIVTNIFRMVLDNYAPIKSKKIRGNHVSSMSKGLSRAVKK